MKLERVPIRPYHYQELDNYATPIKNRLLKISRTLQEGISVVSTGPDVTPKSVISLKNIANSLLELDLKSIYAKNKAYWETRKYAEERIADPQDVEELFEQPKIKRLTENAKEETMAKDIAEVKKLIDRKATDIRIAEKQVRFIKQDPLMLLAKRRVKRPNVKRSPQRVISIRRSLPKLRPKIDTDNVITSPVRPLFPAYSVPKVSQYECMAAKLAVVSETPKLPSINRSKTPYRLQASKIIDECNKWQNSYTGLKASCKDTKVSLNKSLEEAGEQCITDPYQPVLSKDFIKKSVDLFKKNKNCFIYGKEGKGSFIDECGQTNIVQRSDSLAKLNSKLACSFLKDYIKLGNKRRQMIY